MFQAADPGLCQLGNVNTVHSHFVVGLFPVHTWHVKTNGFAVYHGDATQDDDHYDEDVKAFALGDGQAGPPEVRPDFASTSGGVHIQRAASVTTWHTQHRWR